MLLQEDDIPKALQPITRALNQIGLRQLPRAKPGVIMTIAVKTCGVPAQ